MGAQFDVVGSEIGSGGHRSIFVLFSPFVTCLVGVSILSLRWKPSRDSVGVRLVYPVRRSFDGTKEMANQSERLKGEIAESVTPGGGHRPKDLLMLSQIL